MIDRILVLLPVEERTWNPDGPWYTAMARQETPPMWDVLAIDTTARPSPGYLADVHAWARSQPFGRQRVRLHGFSDEPLASAEGGEHGAVETVFSAPWQRTAWALRLGFSCFARWRSYTHLLLCDTTVIPPLEGLLTLYEDGAPWVAGWLPPDRQGLASVWRNLCPETPWTGAALQGAGYSTPPPLLTAPFEVTVTHLGFTLLRRDLAASVQFDLDQVRPDLAYSWLCGSRGWPLLCDPLVCCAWDGASVGVP